MNAKFILITLTAMMMVGCATKTPLPPTLSQAKATTDAKVHASQEQAAIVYDAEKAVVAADKADKQAKKANKQAQRAKERAQKAQKRAERKAQRAEARANRDRQP